MKKLVMIMVLGTTLLLTGCKTNDITDLDIKNEKENTKEEMLEIMDKFQETFTTLGFKEGSYYGDYLSTYYYAEGEQEIAKEDLISYNFKTDKISTMTYYVKSLLDIRDFIEDDYTEGTFENQNGVSHEFFVNEDGLYLVTKSITDEYSYMKYVKARFTEDRIVLSHVQVSKTDSDYSASYIQFDSENGYEAEGIHKSSILNRESYVNEYLDLEGNMYQRETAEWRSVDVEVELVSEMYMTVDLENNTAVNYMQHRSGRGFEFAILVDDGFPVTITEYTNAAVDGSYIADPYYLVSYNAYNLNGWAKLVNGVNQNNVLDEDGNQINRTAISRVFNIGKLNLFFVSEMFTTVPTKEEFNNPTENLSFDLDLYEELIEGMNNLDEMPESKFAGIENIQQDLFDGILDSLPEDIRPEILDFFNQ